jgi:polyribonucleotide nucleotidyltransferase
MNQHQFNIVRKSIDFAGSELKIETGRIARQANGSVLIQYGETVLLVTATASKEVREGTDFFPLTVDYVEKMYASGKIPGGFIKREARPSTDATLLSRLIDRSLRPLFPEGFRNAVHVVITVFAFDGVHEPGPLGIIGASAALSISDIPFNGPIGSVTVGILDNEIVVNPDMDKLPISDLELSVAGSESSIVMIEAGANEVTEDQMMDAVYKGHEYIKEICKFQEEFASECKKEIMEYELYTTPEEIMQYVRDYCTEKIRALNDIKGKLERQEAIKALGVELLEKVEAEIGEEAFAENKKHYKNAYHDVEGEVMRKMIIEEDKRVDGRAMNQIRPISIEVDVLPRVHGSALFTRGETQSIGVVTLGTASDEQIIDGLAEEYRKRYFLHYNFPPYSVGEAGFMRGPGRRELGHGALAERALAPMIPSKEEFPYTIRIVSEITESNGSSSMATVCTGALSMMAAGVPIKKPVAGIANGLIKEGDAYKVLTDIQGLEDHLGDMDFKVTGTRDGITAMQMDIKIQGITREIMKDALSQAYDARNYILDRFAEVITEPRTDINEHAPRIESLKINSDKIGELIGPGGKTIKGIIEETGADINIEDDGTVHIAAINKEAIDRTREIIEGLVFEPERGNIYDGKVTRVEPYGVFVKFMGAKMGLVHVSQICNLRIKHPKDLINLGDTVKVRFTGMSDGKYQLSMKNIEGNPVPDKDDPNVMERKPREPRERRDHKDYKHGDHKHNDRKHHKSHNKNRD